MKVARKRKQGWIELSERSCAKMRLKPLAMIFTFDSGSLPIAHGQLTIRSSLRSSKNPFTMYPLVASDVARCRVRKDLKCVCARARSSRFDEFHKIENWIIFVFRFYCPISSSLRFTFLYRGIVLLFVATYSRTVPNRCWEKMSFLSKFRFSRL